MANKGRKFMTVLLLAVGGVMLLLGAEGMVRGAVGISKRIGVSDLFVGVVIVGFATSAPELFISVEAAMKGLPNIAVGNVVGSNIANILLVLGTGAIVTSLPCRGAAIRRDTLMMALATVALALICFAGHFSRMVGVGLLIILICYVVWTFFDAKRQGAIDALEELEAAKHQSIWRSLLFAAIGLAALLLGTELIITSAVKLAHAFGVSDWVIAVSIVAVGTSLPELAAVTIAAWRGHPEMAVGNVLGSCVFNVFCVLGASAVAAPMYIGAGAFGTDVGVMAASGAALLAMILFIGVVNRIAGFFMLGTYFAYIALVYSQGAI